MWKKIMGIMFLVTLSLVGCGKSVEEQVQEQIDLGNKYMGEMNYEQAIVAFTKAIGLDRKCIEAYAGEIEAYQNLDDMENVRVLYENALVSIHDLPENILLAYKEYIVTVYLVTNDVFRDDVEKAAALLEEGFQITRSSLEIKEELIKAYINLVEQYAKEGISDGEKNQEIKDRLLELIGMGETDSSEEVRGAGHKHTLGELVRIQRCSYFSAQDEQTGYVEYLYDMDGNKIEEINYDSSGNLSVRRKYECDSNGRMIKETSLNAEGNLSNQYTYEYDSTGNLLRKNEYGWECYYYMYEYDAVGKLIEERWYQDNGTTRLNDEDSASYELYEKIVYEYDAEGKKQKMTYLDGADNSMGSYIYEYDTAGNLTKEISCFSDGTIDESYYIEYEYDAFGNMVKKMQCEEDYITSYVMEYDAIGNVIKKSMYLADGSLSNYSIYEYSYE